MSTWTQRARAHFSQKRPDSTDKTDEPPLSSVSSVPPEGFCEKYTAPQQHLSSVSSVPPRPVCEKHALPPIPDWRAERDAARLTEQLLAAAMRAADHHGDDAAAREQWKQDVLATPPELRPDLLAHLNKQYPPAPKRR